MTAIHLSLISINLSFLKPYFVTSIVGLRFIARRSYGFEGALCRRWLALLWVRAPCCALWLQCMWPCSSRRIFEGQRSVSKCMSTWWCSLLSLFIFLYHRYRQTWSPAACSLTQLHRLSYHRSNNYCYLRTELHHLNYNTSIPKLVIDP